MPDKTTSFPLAYRHGYAASFDKEAEDGFMGSIRDWFKGDLLSDKNIQELADTGVSPALTAVTPALTGKSTAPPSGFLGEKGGPGWRAAVDNFFAPTVKDRPPDTTRKRYFGTYGYAGPSMPKYVNVKAEKPRIYESEKGGGKYLRFDPNAEDAKKVYENYIRKSYPEVTFEEAKQLAADLGNRLPIGEGAKVKAFRQAFKDAYQKKDYGRLNRLSNIVAQTPYAGKAKEELLGNIRSTITGKVSKALPYVAGAAAMLPLASMLMSRRQQPQPQRQVQARPAQNMLSESIYRRLGQDHRPVRLS